MKLPFINGGCFNDERGQALIFGALLFVGLLIIGGLAVDSAHLFLKKSRLRRAMDASSMAGITKYVSGVSDLGDVEDASTQIALYNLHAMGLTDDEITYVNANFEVDANQVATLTMTASITIPTLFVRLIPGTGFDSVNIEGGSTSRRVPAVISLVLDTSGSMSGAKLDDLKDGANAFVESFEEGLDQMAIISFSNTAHLLHPMNFVDQSALHAVIDSLDAEGWTNVAEAAALGRKEIEGADDPSAENEPVKVIVVFTDGAPNTFRGIFIDGKNPPLIANYPDAAPVYDDYVLYAGATPITVMDPDTLAVRCQARWSTDVRRCFHSLAYLDSREVLVPGSSSVSRTSRSRMLRETYELPIMETDYAKDDGVTVYTIGLGTPAAEGSDPYQNVTQYSSIKSYFLRRLANDPEVVYDPPFSTLADAGHPEGAYFQTPDSADLISLFETIARRIKLKLIQ